MSRSRGWQSCPSSINKIFPCPRIAPNERFTSLVKSSGVSLYFVPLFSLIRSDHCSSEILSISS